MPYNFADIESKWQARWNDSHCFESHTDPEREKFFCLEMFPYPSGALHMGHIRNVLYTIDFDSFGMPAENAAIKFKTKPHDWTLSNITYMIYSSALMAEKLIIQYERNYLQSLLKVKRFANQLPRNRRFRLMDEPNKTVI